MSDPKENRTPPACILIEQFRRKGYNCTEIKEEDATILIVKHGKKLTGENKFTGWTNGVYNNFLGAN